MFLCYVCTKMLQKHPEQHWHYVNNHANSPLCLGEKLNEKYQNCKNVKTRLAYWWQPSWIYWGNEWQLLFPQKPILVGIKASF